MPSARVIVTIIAGIAAIIACYASRGTYPPPSNWPLGFAMGAFIIIYVVGNILWGVVQGMREAQATPRPPTNTRPGNDRNAE